MIALGRAALALGAIVSIALLAAERHPARGQEVLGQELSGQSQSGQDHSAKASPAAADTCPRSTFRAVVDVGHTVDVPGAMSARGIPEYAFNLQLGKDIKQALLDAGFAQTVLLITATAPWAGLFERAARANSMHANLFISIHHDSVPDTGNTPDRKMNTTMAIRATHFSSQTIMPIGPAACCSAACSDTNWSAGTFITRHITPWH